jgi:hypothetical protein
MKDRYIGPTVLATTVAPLHHNAVLGQLARWFYQFGSGAVPGAVTWRFRDLVWLAGIATCMTPPWVLVDGCAVLGSG